MQSITDWWGSIYVVLWAGDSSSKIEGWVRPGLCTLRVWRCLDATAYA